MLESERRDLRLALIATWLAGCAAVRLAGFDAGLIEIVAVLLGALWFSRRAAYWTAGLASAMLIATFAVDSAYSAAGLPIRVALLFAVAHVAGLLADRARVLGTELDQVRSFQEVLAPREPPQTELLEIASRYIPAEAGVSGDFYLVGKGPNNSTVFVVADVAGKGAPAARRAVFVRAIVGASASYSDDPVGILRTANAELIRQYGPSADFITALCLVVRPDLSVSWASAGHPAPLALADGSPVGGDTNAYPLGIAPEMVGLTATHVQLPKGGLLLFTDGLTDARPPGAGFQPFGTERIGMFLQPLDDPAPEEAVDTLAKAAQVFAGGRLPDDLCLVAIRSRFAREWTRPAAEAESAVMSAQSA